MKTHANYSNNIQQVLCQMYLIFKRKKFAFIKQYFVLPFGVLAKGKLRKTKLLRNSYKSVTSIA